MKRIHIVAAIIFNQDKSKFLLQSVQTTSIKAGFGSFPAGKSESGESIEHALARELEEEVGIEVTEQALFEHLEYDYPDKSLKFDFITVSKFSNEPYGREGQEGRWVEIRELGNYAFPEANVPILVRVVKEFA
ncbi:LOW QUALITY PROTEIN: mutator MutT protein [Vibrio sp. JCM 18904]|nr:LOW QUALITY PROTEIN: mutator MutT protein [Vibrio sp. JCM 18904]